MAEPADRFDTNGGGSGPRPMDGVRILAVEHMLAAPYATMLLADFGADTEPVLRNLLDLNDKDLAMLKESRVV